MPLYVKWNDCKKIKIKIYVLDEKWDSDYSSWSESDAWRPDSYKKIPSKINPAIAVMAIILLSYFIWV